jgi:transposase
MSNLFWLTEAQMARRCPFFPKSHGRPCVDDLRVLSSIIFINRNGLQWCDAPTEYAPAKTLYNRWKRWSEKGVFARIMVGLAAESTDPKTIMISSR